MPKLSICIPTYNRGAYIGQAIESIVRQADADTEIVISDNASTDGTESIVRDWQQRYSRIVYHRNLVNQGADRNYLQVIQCASGDFCWFLGSDDALADGAIAMVRASLAESPTVIVTDRRNMSCDMQHTIFKEKVLDAPHGDVFNCGDHHELLRYFKSARTFTALFPYLSNLIFRREEWLRHIPAERFVGSAYIHVVQLLSMLNGQGAIRYCNRAVVLNRTDNDSFLAALGHSRRALIDLNYLSIADHVFARQPELRAALHSAMHRFCFGWAPLMHRRLLCLCDDAQSVKALEAGYRRAFADRPDYLLKMAAWRGVPGKLLQWLYRHRGPFVSLRRNWLSGPQARWAPRRGSASARRSHEKQISPASLV